MAMQWSPALSVGVEAIDQQHKELIAKINELVAASGAGKGKDEIAHTIKFLEDYVVMHFSMEERQMLVHVYPEATEHKAQHAAFIRDFTALKRRFTEEGASSTLTIQLQHQVCDWLLGHINKTDKALGAYLKAQ